MSKLMLFTLSLVMPLTLVSCSKTDVSLPEPAPAIEGIYKATTFFSSDTLSYPIQGQTMTLKLTSVSRDSVRVEIEAAPNGSYSPGGNRTYEKLVVYQGADAKIVNKQSQSCISYQVRLTRTPTVTRDEALTMRCGSSGAIDYSFTSPTNQTSVVVRFVKM
jgi:hypothetical protein